MPNLLSMIFHSLASHVPAACDLPGNRKPMTNALLITCMTMSLVVEELKLTKLLLPNKCHQFGKAARGIVYIMNGDIPSSSKQIYSYIVSCTFGGRK